MTHSESSFAVRKYNQHALNTTSFNDVILKKIVCYLKESKKLGFKYSSYFKIKNRKLFSYTDALYKDCFDKYSLISNHICL